MPRAVSSPANHPAHTDLQERVPVSSLRRHVTCVWILKVGRDGPPYTHRIVPNGSAELICTPGSMPEVVGPQTRPDEQVLGPGSIRIAIRSRPGALPAIFRFPASALVDRTVALDDLWTREARDVGDRVANSTSVQQAAEILEHEMGLRLSETSRFDIVAGRCPPALPHHAFS